MSSNIFNVLIFREGVIVSKYENYVLNCWGFPFTMIVSCPRASTRPNRQKESQGHYFNFWHSQYLALKLLKGKLLFFHFHLLQPPCQRRGLGSEKCSSLESRIFPDFDIHSSLETCYLFTKLVCLEEGCNTADCTFIKLL